MTVQQEKINYKQKPITRKIQLQGERNYKKIQLQAGTNYKKNPITRLNKLQEKPNYKAKQITRKSNYKQKAITSRNQLQTELQLKNKRHWIFLCISGLEQTGNLPFGSLLMRLARKKTGKRRKTTEFRD